MLPDHLDALVQDLRLNRDVTARLQKAFRLSARDLPRAQRLELTKAVLSAVSEIQSEHAHNAFLEAIESLRGLAPFLKTKGQSLLHTVAAIEKYSVNHASSLCFDAKLQPQQVLSSIDKLMEKTLKLVLESRSQLKLSNDTPRRRGRQLASFEKENRDPSCVKHDLVMNAATLDCLLHRGASKYNVDWLRPQDDSATVAVVICGALTVRLVNAVRNVHLQQLLVFVQELVSPWLLHLRSLSLEANGLYNRNFTVYAKRVQKSILQACHDADKDPCTVLRARAHALTIGEVKLNQYARDLLRSVHCVTRSKSCQCPHGESVFDVAGSVYDEALEFASRFSFRDPRWFSEDVSAWMDHIAVVWAHRSYRTATPMIFSDRLTAAKKSACSSGLVGTYELQLSLIKHNAYDIEQFYQREGGRRFIRKSTELMLMTELPKFRIPGASPSKLNDDVGARRNKDMLAAERAGLERLRLLRTLEPCRKHLIRTPDSSAENHPLAEVLHDVYVSALLDGLVQLEDHSVSSKSEHSTNRADIISRLRKMICAGLESLKELLILHFNLKDTEKACYSIKCAHLLLQMHEESGMESAQVLRKWLSGFVLASLQSALNKLNARSEPPKRKEAMFVTRVATEATKVLCSTEDAHLSVSQQLGLLEVARTCHISLGNWAKSANISLQMLALLERSAQKSHQQNDKNLLQSLCNSFARDLSLSLDSGDSFSLNVNDSCAPTLALFAVLEYSSWVKQDSPTWRETRKTRDSFHSALKLRKHVLQCLSEVYPLCSQRRLHLYWISYVLSEIESKKFDDNGSFLQSPRTSRDTGCDGHGTAIVGTAKQAISKCSQTHLALISCVAKMISSLLEGSEIDETQLTVFHQSLEAAQSLPHDIELLHISSEVLEWLGTKLSVDDRFEHATLVYEAAKRCRSYLGIQTSPMPVAVVCRQLIDYASVGKGGKVPSRGRDNDGVIIIDEDPQSFNYFLTAGIYCCTGGAPRGSLESANKELKSSLMHVLRSQPEGGTCASTSNWNVAGVDLNISFDERFECGQAMLCKLLSLLKSLYTLSLALLSAESLSDGRYYLERCADLASYCLPSRNYFVQSVHALHAAVAVPSSEALSVSQSFQLTRAEDTELSFSRDPMAKMHYMRTVCGIGLKTLSGNLTSALDTSAGEVLLEIHKDWETALQEHMEEDCTMRNEGLSGHFLLSTAATHAFLGQNSFATNSLKALIDSQVLSFHVEVISLYFLARTYVQNAGTVTAFLNECKPRMSIPRKQVRITRSRARKQGYQGTTAPDDEITAEVKNLLTKARRKMVNSVICPQLSRRVWNLSGMLEENAEAAVSALQKTIGCSFDIRWLAVQNKGDKGIRKSSLGASQAAISTLDDAFQKMTIASERTCFDFDFEEFLELLKSTRCVVVGLTTDETKSSLVVWRISGNGIVSKRVTIADKGRTSISGIMSRLRDVMTSMKENAVKSGQAMTQKQKQDWWDHRYSLDADVQSILSDIESKWLGDVKALLLPSIFDDADLAQFARVEDQDDTVEALFRLSRDAFPNAFGNHGSRQRDKPGAAKATDWSASLGQLVLLMDTALERIPWESIPVLRELNVSVTRTPSLQFLRHHLVRAREKVDPLSLFYVINPAGDLKRTEETFKELLERSGWRGSFGKTCKEAVQAAYRGEDIFLYCGHGAGDQFLSPRKFSRFGGAPIALLMGCSSGRPDNIEMGDCESNGAAIDYLIHGSRAVVATLWDVSDKDIDRFTSSVLSSWLGVGNDDAGPQEQANLSEAVAESRSTCRLPFLVGSAAVVMGAPNIVVDDTGSS